MPTTFYSPADLSGIVRVSTSLVNTTETGTGFDVNINGSDIKSNPTAIAQCLAIGVKLSAGVNHSTPPSPIHPNARIKKITMRFQDNALIVSNSAQTSPPSSGIINANTAYHLEFQAFLPGSPTEVWITSPSPAVEIIDHGVSVPSGASAVSYSGGHIREAVYDFNANPNGDFPLRYCSYLTFVINFSAIGYNVHLNTNATVSGSFVGGAWSLDSSIVYTATNWVMEVEWELPSSWSLASSTITLPDNIITITRPESLVPPGDEDTEQVEKIQIGDTIIEPNDPWVIIWTKFEIRFHLPTEEKYDPNPEITLFFIGTEFSGSVSSIPLTIVYADLSGIYQLDDSIHHDVLYERTATPITQNVAIPAPFFVTHFVDTPEADISHYAGTRMGIVGQGIVKQVFQSDDYIQTLQFGNTVLRTSNNRSPFSLANFTDQHASVRVYMDQIDDFMRVDQLIIFTKPVFTGYPQ